MAQQWLGVLVALAKDLFSFSTGLFKTIHIHSSGNPIGMHVLVVHVHTWRQTLTHVSLKERRQTQWGLVTLIFVCLSVCLSEEEYERIQWLSGFYFGIEADEKMLPWVVWGIHLKCQGELRCIRLKKRRGIEARLGWKWESQVFNLFSPDLFCLSL